MADEKDLVVLDMATPVARKLRRVVSPPCPMDIDRAETAWNEHARRRPPAVTLKDPLVWAAWPYGI
jgi:hypothetical protein